VATLALSPAKVAVGLWSRMLATPACCMEETIPVGAPKTAGIVGTWSCGATPWPLKIFP
jgi:hypothetical protein